MYSDKIYRKMICARTMDDNRQLEKILYKFFIILRDQKRKNVKIIDIFNRKLNDLKRQIEYLVTYIFIF